MTKNVIQIRMPEKLAEDIEGLVKKGLYKNRYELNKTFLNETEEKFTSIFNLFELLGIASFNLNEVELTKLFKGFGEVYGLKILYPSTAFISVNDFVETLFETTFQKIKMKLIIKSLLKVSLSSSENSLKTTPKSFLVCATSTFFCGSDSLTKWKGPTVLTNIFTSSDSLKNLLIMAISLDARPYP